MRLSSGSYVTVQGDTAYVWLGPFSAGDVLEELHVAASALDALDSGLACIVGASLHKQRRADHPVGVHELGQPLLGRGEVDGLPALGMVASTPVGGGGQPMRLELELEHGGWVLVTFYNMAGSGGVAGSASIKLGHRRRRRS